MGIYAIARGEVVAEPAQLTTDSGTATVMVVRDCGDAPGAAPPGVVGSSVSGAVDLRSGYPAFADGVEYEVSCRETRLAQRVLADLLVGDRVVVVGTLHLDRVSGPVEDPSSVARVSLEAIVVGWDLGWDLGS